MAGLGRCVLPRTQQPWSAIGDGGGGRGVGVKPLLIGSSANGPTLPGTSVPGDATALSRDLVVGLPRRNSRWAPPVPPPHLLASLGQKPVCRGRTCSMGPVVSRGGSEGGGGRTRPETGWKGCRRTLQANCPRQGPGNPGFIACLRFPRHSSTWTAGRDSRRASWLQPSCWHLACCRPGTLAGAQDAVMGVEAALVRALLSSGRWGILLPFGRLANLATRRCLSGEGSCPRPGWARMVGMCCWNVLMTMGMERCRGCVENVGLEDMFSGQEDETCCRNAPPPLFVHIKVDRMPMVACNCAVSRKSAVGNLSGQVACSDFQMLMMSHAYVGLFGWTLSLMDEKEETCPSRSRGVMMTLEAKGRGKRIPASGP